MMTTKRIGAGVAAIIAALGLGFALTSAGPAAAVAPVERNDPTSAVERPAGGFIRGNAQTEDRDGCAGKGGAPEEGTPESSPNTDL